jgi:hypothetical protein
VDEPFQQGKSALRPRPQVREASWVPGAGTKALKCHMDRSAGIIGDDGNRVVKAGVPLVGPWGFMMMDVVESGKVV